MATNEYKYGGSELLVRHDRCTAGDPWVADWRPTPLKPSYPGINENGGAIVVNISQDADPIRTQNTKKQEDKMGNKRGLYQVYVVNPETSEVLLPRPMVASDEARAQMKAAADLALDGDLDDYDFIVQRLGDVRPKPDND